MSDLHEKRLENARITKGISGNPVYRMVRRIRDKAPLRHDVLDFGAGIGNLARQIMEEGYTGNLTCADIQPRPADLPETVRWIEADLNEPLPLPDASFDTVLSTEVLPSLENPRHVFREFHRLLRPGGTLIVTQPNQESIRSLVALCFRGHFAAFPSSFPPHITALLHEDFRRICAATGFTPPQFCYMDDGNLPRFQSICWQKISWGLLKGRLFSDNLGFIAHKL